ncbi:putative CRM domain-containing protein, chloroplastic [Vitis vinifera]|uniref:Putative CRM domain-containing protein, chloroplastic n=1 Tax=Vitis vinifera TaxID=29760 RepID=A0A438IUW5_VITVI|nr:putative CRM domain-containing protein, chloroplastic [Vitis vinifera]
MHPRSYKVAAGECVWSPCNTLLWHGSNMVGCGDALSKWARARYMSNTSIELKPDSDVVRFNIGEPPGKTGTSKKGKKKMRRVKMSRKAKLNELRSEAKRKEEWLIEKLRKFDIPKAPTEAYDPEILTEEEKFYLKRTGEKKKNYVPVGRRGVFGGVVLNMHLHWKKHETVKVICKPCKVGQVYEYAEELARLSKGIMIDIKPNNTIIFYRGKNYVQPQVMSPPDTLSKSKLFKNEVPKHKLLTLVDSDYHLCGLWLKGLRGDKFIWKFKIYSITSQSLPMVNDSEPVDHLSFIALWHWSYEIISLH